jgi:putative redox protein
VPARNADDEGAVIVETTGEGDFQVAVRTAGVRFLADEPNDSGGPGSGPTPYDLLCAALGACTAMTLGMYAHRKAWPLKGARVETVLAPRSDT